MFAVKYESFIELQFFVQETFGKNKIPNTNQPRNKVQFLGPLPKDSTYQNIDVYIDHSGQVRRFSCVHNITSHFTPTFSNTALLFPLFNVWLVFEY